MNRRVQRIAFIVYPRLTLLDFVGPYDALRRVATMGFDGDLTWRILGTTEEVADDSGLALSVDGVYEPLDGFDLLVVPGGHGSRALAGDARFLAWLRSWGPERPVASVCTGALLLGAAGLLAGLPATTHQSALDDLRPYCAEVVTDRRVVEAGRVLTAGGVTAGIDLGLHLVARFFGAEAAARIAGQMEWPHSAGA
jgi:cyclohexyl-isocyanide hydratase